MKSLYLFDSDQKLIKIIPYKSLVTLVRKQELRDNDLPLDRFTAVYKAEEYLDYKNIYYFAIKDLHNSNAFHIYFNQESSIDDNLVNLEGIQLGYKELKHFIVDDKRPTKNAAGMLREVLVGTNWRIGFVASTNETQTNFYHQTVLDCLLQISQIYDLILEFKVELSGQKITDKWVEAYARNSKKEMKRFTTKSNALTIVQKINRIDTVSGVIPYGKGKQKLKDDGSPTGGYGRKITIENIAWSKGTNPLYKPLGQKYLEIPEVTREIGINMLDGSKQPALVQLEFDTDDENELINLAYKALIDLIRDKIEFETDVINIGEVEIGEVATIHNYDKGFHYEAPIFRVDTDFLSPQKTKIKLGDKISKSRAEKRAQTYRSIQQAKIDAIEESKENTGNFIDSYDTHLKEVFKVDFFNDIHEVIEEVLPTADGKNTINFTNTEPTQKRVGDLWVRDHPSKPGQTQWLIWNGTNWEIRMDTSTSSAAEEAVEESKKLIEDAKQEALDAVKQAEDRTNISIDDKLKSAKKNILFDINDAAGYALIKIGTNGQSSMLNITKNGAYMDNAFIQSAHIANGVINTAHIGDLNFDWASGKTLDAQKVNVINLNASNIVSGRIDASRIAVNNLNASNITSGILDASRITVNNLNASKITSGTLDASKVNVTNLSASNIKTGKLSSNYIDLSGNLDLKGRFKTYFSDSSYTAVDLNGTRLDFYDPINKSRVMGSIGTTTTLTVKGSYAYTYPLITLGHESSGMIQLRKRFDSDSESNYYLLCDKDYNISYHSGYPNVLYQSTMVRGKLQVGDSYDSNRQTSILRGTVRIGSFVIEANGKEIRLYNTEYNGASLRLDGRFLKMEKGGTFKTIGYI